MKKPLYETILQQLERRIQSGQYEPSAPFCTEKSLCEEYGVSRVTAKRAIEELEKRGLLSRKRGAGSFVVPGAEELLTSSGGGRRKGIRRIALVMPFIDSRSGMFSVIHSATETLGINGCYLTLHVTQGSRAHEEELLERLSDADGVLFYPNTSIPYKRLSLFSQQNKPVIILDWPNENPAFSSVMCDNVTGGYLLTEHLCAYGHRRICYLSRHIKETIGSIRQRFEGCLKYIEAHQPDLVPRFVRLEMDETASLDYQLLKHTINMLYRDGFTAILCENDEMAFHAAMCCDDLGIHLPRDMSLTGFDNISWSTTGNASITTVDQCFDDIGREIGSILLQEDYKPRHVIVPVRLVPRHSTGPADRSGRKPAKPDE
ncbi:MAG TPA: GntR family transcriptional regulator [Clostridia bacterium]|nr:GntR family transcriptional regulator [Clostridia bacterium]